MLAERHEKAVRELKKRERERRRLELGDEFDSAQEGQLSDSDSSDSSSWSESDSSEEDTQMRIKSPEQFQESPSKRGRSSVRVDAAEFNALRFVGEALKSMKK